MGFLFSLPSFSASAPFSLIALPHIPCPVIFPSLQSLSFFHPCPLISSHFIFSLSFPTPLSSPFPLSFPALLQTGLTVPRTHTFMEHLEQTPKQSLHSPISTRGLLVVLLPQIVVLCFPRVPLPGKIRALISHPWGTAGEEVTALRAGQGGSHRKRARGGRHGAILPRGAQPVPRRPGCLPAVGYPGCCVYLGI